MVFRWFFGSAGQCVGMTLSDDSPEEDAGIGSGGDGDGLGGEEDGGDDGSECSDPIRAMRQEDKRPSVIKAAPIE
ncbi:MAG: hypothetical protein ACO39C_09995 [Chthoniobacterales bacterium]